jgi:hypothetical protein
MGDGIGLLLEAEVDPGDLVQRLLEHALDPGVAHLLEHGLAVFSVAAGAFGVYVASENLDDPLAKLLVHGATGLVYCSLRLTQVYGLATTGRCRTIDILDVDVRSKLPRHHKYL